MQEIEIRLCSVQDVQEFVALATAQPFVVMVGNHDHMVSGQCFMEMFCLDFTRPMFACAECSEEAFAPFRAALAKFAAQ